MSSFLSACLLISDMTDASHAVICVLNLIIIMRLCTAVLNGRITGLNWPSVCLSGCPTCKGASSTCGVAKHAMTSFIQLIIGRQAPVRSLRGVTSHATSHLHLALSAMASVISIIVYTTPRFTIAARAGHPFRESSAKFLACNPNATCRPMNCIRLVVSMIRLRTIFSTTETETRKTQQ